MGIITKNIRFKKSKKLLFSPKDSEAKFFIKPETDH